MKHDLTTRAIATFAAAALLALAAGAAVAQAPPPGAPPGAPSASSPEIAMLMPAGDAAFVRAIATTNTAELDQAKYVVNRTADPAVRAFAQRMIDDHSTAAVKLQATTRGTAPAPRAAPGGGECDGAGERRHAAQRQRPRARPRVHADASPRAPHGAASRAMGSRPRPVAGAARVRRRPRAGDPPAPADRERVSLRSQSHAVRSAAREPDPRKRRAERRPGRTAAPSTTPPRPATRRIDAGPKQRRRRDDAERVRDARTP